MLTRIILFEKLDTENKKIAAQSSLERMGAGSRTQRGWVGFK